jgi:hypothetical protein
MGDADGDDMRASILRNMMSRSEGARMAEEMGKFVASELEPLRKQQIAAVAQIAELKNDVMALRARIDQLEQMTGTKRLRIVQNRGSGAA